MFQRPHMFGTTAIGKRSARCSGRDARGNTNWFDTSK
jgi:hypothetical protein